MQITTLVIHRRVQTSVPLTALQHRLATTTNAIKLLQIQRFLVKVLALVSYLTLLKELNHGNNLLAVVVVYLALFRNAQDNWYHIMQTFDSKLNGLA